MRKMERDVKKTQKHNLSHTHDAAANSLQLYFTSSTSFSGRPSSSSPPLLNSFLRKISSMFTNDRGVRFGLNTRRSSSSNSLSSVSVSPNCKLSILSASPPPPPPSTLSRKQLLSGPWLYDSRSTKYCSFSRMAVRHSVLSNGGNVPPYSAGRKSFEMYLCSEFRLWPCRCIYKNESFKNAIETNRLQAAQLTRRRILSFKKGFNTARMASK